MSFNETQMNLTIDHRIGLNGFITSGTANITYYLNTNPNNYINLTTGQALNDTALINAVNSSLWNYINSNQANWSRDTIWNITGSNYLINISGILNINETTLDLTINNLANRVNGTTLHCSNITLTDRD